MHMVALWGDGRRAVGGGGESGGDNSFRMDSRVGVGGSWYGRRVYNLLEGAGEDQELDGK